MSTVLPEPEQLLADASERSPETLSGIEFSVRKVTPKDSELWLRMGLLRAESYLKRGYITAEDLDEDGAEYDDFDPQASHFIAVNDEGEVIGNVRVINRGDGTLSLPAEEEFERQLPELTQEISRLIRSDDLPATEGVLVSLSLMRAALRETIGRSDKIYAVLEDSLHRELGKQIGINLTTVGEPRVIEHYNDTVNHLVEMEPYFITSQIHARDQERLARIRGNKRLEETIIGKPYAPFFEKLNAQQGLGRVSLLDLTSPNPDQFERNAFYSPAEQERLHDSVVSFAGAGGDGGQLAIALAMAGVRKFRVADPERFEIQNLNRQAGASLATIGHNKAEVIAQILRDLGAEVEVFNQGVNEENIEAFTNGADLIFDETEFTMPQLGAMIARSARAKEIPVLMALNIGFGSYTTTFDPKGITFEEYLGLDPKMSLEEIAAWAENPEHDVPIDKWAPHIPTYASVDMLRQVVRDEIPTPTVVQGVLSAAADAGTQAVALLLKDVNPNWKDWITMAPYGRSVDMKDGIKIVKARSFEFTKGALVAKINTSRGKSHPKR